MDAAGEGEGATLPSTLAEGGLGWSGETGDEGQHLRDACCGGERSRSICSDVSTTAMPSGWRAVEHVDVELLLVCTLELVNLLSMMSLSVTLAKIRLTFVESLGFSRMRCATWSIGVMPVPPAQADRLKLVLDDRRAHHRAFELETVARLQRVDVL